MFLVIKLRLHAYMADISLIELIDLFLHLAIVQILWSLPVCRVFDFLHMYNWELVLLRNI